MKKLIRELRQVITESINPSTESLWFDYSSLLYIYSLFEKCQCISRCKRCKVATVNMIRSACFHQRNDVIVTTPMQKGFCGKQSSAIGTTITIRKGWIFAALELDESATLNSKRYGAVATTLAAIQLHVTMLADYVFVVKGLCQLSRNVLMCTQYLHLCNIDVLYLEGSR